MKINLPFAAALMLGTAALVAPQNSLAQDSQEKMQDRATTKEAPSKSQARSSDEKGKGDNAARSSENSDKGDRSERNDKKSADRSDDGGKDQGRSASQDDNRKSRAEDDSSGKGRSRASDEKSSKDKAAQSDKDKPSEQKADRQDTSSKSGSTADTDKAGKSGASQASGDREKADKVRNADLSGDKKNRVKTAFHSENIKKITNVNVDISVGRRLPRDWDYRPVPSAVISIVPEYRGYYFAYVEDRYVIVEPDTYEVVYVLEADGSSSNVGRSSGESGSSGKCSTDVTFSKEDRTFILEKVRHSHSVKLGDLRVGLTVPKDIEVETFPSEVTSRVSTLDRCRYVVVDDRVAVIDPDADKVVAIIE